MFVPGTTAAGLSGGDCSFQRLNPTFPASCTARYSASMQKLQQHVRADRSLLSVCTPISCYTADIQRGQGLYFETISQTWRAKNCLTNTYGYTNNTFGLQATPCKDCPDGTEANTKYSKSSPFFKTNADGTGGFVSEMACVTKPGAKTALHWLLSYTACTALFSECGQC